MPEGYQCKDGIAWGTRVPGLLEIKFHSMKTRNASRSSQHLMMSQIINAAQKDEKIKVILLHGGKYYSSGNDLKALMKGGSNLETMARDGRIGIFDNMNPYLNAINDSVKPVVGVIRGGAIGIGFT